VCSAAQTGSDIDTMATIASESPHASLEGVSIAQLLDGLPDPLVIRRDGQSAWLNAAARELDAWLREGDPARSLERELERLAWAAQPAAAPTMTLRNATGDERAFRATALRGPRDGSAMVLSRASGVDVVLDQLDAQVHSEIAHARLEEVQRQLLQADRLSTIGQLAAGVAHEINNPIGYIQSNLGTLRDYVTSLFRLIGAQDAALRNLRAMQPDQLQQLEQVRHEIDFDFLATDLPTLLSESQEGISRVRKIIQDLREFSRAGHSEEWTLADIHAGIDSTINIVWNDLKYKAQLIKSYGELPPVECLPSQLNQVFMNVLVNAGHAIETRGQITIATHADAEFAWIEFSDTGKGIAAEHLARVFEPFFTTKPVGKGTGLGLSISYGIVRKHAGEIDVRSEPGVGTTFIIKLPLRQRHQRRATDAKRSDAGTTS
jgi:signal transduction histidine kinase